MGGSDFHGVVTQVVVEPKPSLLEPVIVAQEPIIAQEPVLVQDIKVDVKTNSIEEPVVQNIITFAVNKTGNIIVLKDDSEIAEIRPYTVPNHLQKELECMRKEIGTERFISFIPTFAKIYAESRSGLC